MGAGNSTAIAALACSRNGVGKITAVASNPTGVLRICRASYSGTVQLVENPVQLTVLKVFKELRENDILFIDSTHVSKIGSDVNYLLLEILPQLERGVLIHPLEMPRGWIEDLHLFWNEQYLVHALLIGNRDFEILLGNSYMSLYHPEKISSLFDINNKHNGVGGCSL